MKIKFFSLILFMGLASWNFSAKAAEIPIVVCPSSGSLEKMAAGELAGYLRRLYPADRFPVLEKIPQTDRLILLGTIADPRIRELADAERLKQGESYTVFTKKERGTTIGVIAGVDVRGVMYGVYGLLRHLGCGFYLSYDAMPAAESKTFNFAGWDLADAPLVGSRLVFNWHNFLSGCSTWNLADWQKWIHQSQKMGYNAIMVHAYGNNPMMTYELSGKQKPVGFLSTTVKGRDWSTMHVNDVRRLWGGQVFQSPVFGSSAGQVADDQRIPAVQKLMAETFAYAKERALDVYFALDVDTVSANPQELILTLPESARFAIQTGEIGWMGQSAQRFWLANPDTPEGYQYYKAQVDALLKVYPAINHIVVWFRTGGTPWMGFKVEDMPSRWQAEFRAEVARTPEAGKFWKAHNLFALAKIARGFERALKESGRQGIRLATGTWNFQFLPAADRFMPVDVQLIGLDYDVIHERPRLGTAESRQVFRDLNPRRAVIPVVWAQHDDGHYIGRPYLPLADFHAKLKDARAAGFGIIHWTTRPLDLYFVSLAEQVWQRTADRPLRQTCLDMAERSFGVEAKNLMGAYLEAWVTGAPQFARETGDWFIDRVLKDIDRTVAGCRQRLKLIDQVNTAKLSPSQLDRLNYYRGLEEFIIAFHQDHDRFQKSQQLLGQGDLVEARRIMNDCHPEKVIEQFARFSSLEGMTTGEQGLVVSTNLRWLPHLLHHRQHLGLEPRRICFGPTQHDPLAQAPGRFTFHVGPDHAFWECWGEKETGGKVFKVPAAHKISLGKDLADSLREIGQTGVESDQPLTLAIRPTMALQRKGTKTALPRKGRLTLLFLDPDSKEKGQRVFDVSVGPAETMEHYSLDPPVEGKFLRLLCHGNSENDWNSLVEVQLDGLPKNIKPFGVTASSSVAGFPAEHAVDGDENTRWAARGKDEWIQFGLVPGAMVKNIGLKWFQAGRRKAIYEVQSSSDGKTWKAVKHQSAAAGATPNSDRLDIFQATGQANTLMERHYDVVLSQDGSLLLRLTPVKGKASLCGIILDF